MSDGHDYLALDWVRGEIEATLKQAQQSLESFVENPEDTTRMRFCMTYIHQVHGTLQMVEFYGAALLAEEMEKLAQALMNNEVSNLDDALEVLMRAILQLPPYLERVKSSRKDLPVVLLPLLNDLRAARGESLMSETAMFNPDLSAASRGVAQAVAKENEKEFIGLLKKVRQVYQMALVGFIRGKDEPASLKNMLKVMKKMAQVSGDAAIAPLWKIGEGMLEGLASGTIETGTSVKMLMGRIDRQIKHLTEAGSEALNEEIPRDLLKNLLYYIAKSPGTTPVISSIKADYSLADALPSDEMIDQERAAMSGPDKDTMNSVVLALSDELNEVKDALDMFMRSDQRSLEDLQPLSGKLKQVSDTIAVLGMGQQRKIIQEQYEVLQSIVDSGQLPDDSALMDIAGSVLYVESTLGSGGAASPAPAGGSGEDVVEISPNQISSAHEAVLRESRAGLEKAKDSIIEFIASQWERAHLEPVPGLLTGVRGGLDIVGLKRPAILLNKCVQYVNNELLGEGTSPDWDQMDTLADAITSVEYYLERLADDAGTDDYILDIAEESVAELGYPLNDSEKAQGAEPVAAEEPEEAEVNEIPELEVAGEDIPVVDDIPVAGDVVPPGEEEAESPPPEEIIKPEIPVIEAVEESPEESQEESQEESIEEPQEEPVSEEPEVLAAEAVEPEPEPEIAPEPEAGAEPQAAAEEDDLIDDEIIEIFEEEVEEVLETLGEFFPRWAANMDDEESLVEFRRAFHTLKGSGRMVGALVVGELAWSIENMLNRVIDNTIKPTGFMVDLISRVTEMVPGLVQAFEKRTDPPYDTEPFMAVANALADGEQVDELPEISASAGAAAEEAGAAEEPEAVIEADEGEFAEPEPVAADEPAPEEPEIPLMEVEEPVELPVLEEAAGEEAEVPELVQPEEEIVEEISFEEEAVEAVSAEGESWEESDEIENVSFVDATPEVEEAEGDAFDEIEGMSEDEVEGLMALSGDDSEDFGELDDFGLGLDTGLADEPEAGVTESVAEEALERGEVEPGPTEEVDQTLVGIFRAETAIHIETIRSFISAHLDSQSDIEIPDELLKALHTLKGSANMAEMVSLVAIAKPTEQFFKQLRDHRQRGNADIVQILETFIPLVTDGLDQLGESLEGEIEGAEAYLEQLEALQQEYEAAFADQRAEALDAKATGADPGLVSTFLAQGMEFILDAEDIINEWQKDPESGVDLQELQRELSRLALGARKVDLAPMAELSEALVNCYRSVDDGKTELDDLFFEAVADGHDQLINMMDFLAAGQTVKTPGSLIEQVKALTAEQFVDAIVESSDLEEELAEAPETAAESVPEPPPVQELPEPVEVDRDPELVEIFLEEAEEILESVAASLQHWMEDANNLLEVQSLQRDLHTLKGGARMAEIPELGDISHELENLYEGLCEGRLTAQPALFDLLHSCHDRIADMVDGIRDNKPIRAAADLIAQIEAYIRDPSGFDASAVAVATSPAAEPAVEERQGEAGEEERQEQGQHDLDSSISIGDEADPEILGIFMEEVDELTEDMDNNIAAWLDDRGNMDYLDELKRVLHTLKGGARLAGLSQLGNTSHDFETFLIDAQSSGASLDEAFFSRVHQFQDVISGQIEQVKALAAGEIEAATPLPVPEPEGEAPAGNVVPLQQPAEDSGKAIERIQESLQKKDSGARQDEQPAQKRQQPQEMVRVPADLLERLVNLAGETSISRGRVEQSVNDFSFSLEDMGQTIERLAEQLRRMDKETEEQILSSYNQAIEAGGQEVGEGEEFDLLEMDEYSQLHQLSKALAESASDLVDIKETLLNRARDTETILRQQSRVNTELQEGLMRTRMVPFSRLVPRLRRIVRQVGGEVGKPVELNVINPEGELDRTLLEKIVAPLEHMLRNAVDHGIEDPQGRQQSGKAATGQVNLELGREGGEVVLTLTDDGKGIDVDAVRRKAIDRGLLEEGSAMPDQEVMQFILQAGFSTAQAVTQISGRGVGMDVVSSEIKQMGGSLSINSVRGQGTQFTVRLPFTVAMNRALLVGVGEDTYAIPLNQIEGIVRISPYELEAYYSGDAEQFEYAGVDYQLVYMGHYVHNKNAPNLDGITSPLPVLLVSFADLNIAIQVDSLMGAREVVVKSIGPQLASVSGLSGATILGDGSVVIILDVAAMVRADAVTPEAIEHAVEEEVEAVAEPEVNQTPVIMVTDDSVTVRKVTGRFLERQGFEVVTAKDGMDAIAKLDDFVPDLMLLDIEMPRMDGFEVATHVRHDDRLVDVPIIMITSRTGEKHRERAFGIGVNAYMGKPFQEGELLETINELLEQARSGKTEPVT